ncbi:MAG: helix-turn-helix domain-containing protein [Acholeplasmataceae bacterium]
MYGYFLLIKGVDALTTSEYDVLMELLNELLLAPTFDKRDDVLVIIDKQKTDVSWGEFIRNTNSEFYSDLRLYESNGFHSHQALSLTLNESLKRPLFTKTYTNDKILFYDEFYKHVTEDFKKEIFKSLYNDLEFLRSIKIYIEQQNKSKAAKLANIHRNTLDNRLEKFTRITGFDLANFDDKAFIYIFLREL